MVTQEQLEEVYKEYPKKLGKTQGMKKAQKVIKTVFHLDDLKLAISNYKKHIARENIKPTYVMYFSTFMNQWEDWLEVDVGVVEKTDSFQEQAQKVLSGIRKFSSYESDKLKVYLGEDLFKRACKVPGGISAIRQMPANDFTAQKLSGLLRDASVA